MKLQSFRNDQRGAIAIMVAFLLPIMIVASALGIESMRVLREKARLQHALDAAALAAGQARFGGATDESIRAIVDELVKANLAGSELATPTVTINTGGGTATSRMTLDATASLSGVGMGGSSKNFEIGADSVAETSNQKVEVSLVLDTTLSMSFDGKMDQLKLSAKAFASRLMMQPDGVTPRPNVSIAVVPFNDYVFLKTTDYRGKNVDWLTDTGDITQEFKEGGGFRKACPGGYTDIPASDCGWVATPTNKDGKLVSEDKWVCKTAASRRCDAGEIDESIPQSSRFVTMKWHGAVISRTPPTDRTIDGVGAAGKYYAFTGFLPGSGGTHPLFRTDTNAAFALERLTDDKSKVDYVINNLVPHGETYTAAGMLWGWHTLDPGAPFGDGAPYGDALKVIILMTDGVNTKSTLPHGETGYFNHTGSDAASANTTTLALCSAVKQKGVRVYSIAYMFENGNDVPAAKQMLQSCASDNARFFDATSKEKLDRAFTDIIAELIPLRLAE